MLLRVLGTTSVTRRGRVSTPSTRTGLCRKSVTRTSAGAPVANEESDYVPLGTPPRSQDAKIVRAPTVDTTVRSPRCRPHLPTRDVETHDTGPSSVRDPHLHYLRPSLMGPRDPSRVRLWTTHRPPVDHPWTDRVDVWNKEGDRGGFGRVSETLRTPRGPTPVLSANKEQRRTSCSVHLN